MNTVIINGRCRSGILLLCSQRISLHNDSATINNNSNGETNCKNIPLQFVVKHQQRRVRAKSKPRKVNSVARDRHNCTAHHQYLGSRSKITLKRQCTRIHHRGCHVHVRARTTPPDRQTHKDALQQRDVECLLWCGKTPQVQHDRGGEGHVDKAQTTHTGIRIVHGADAAAVHAADLRVLRIGERERERPKAVRNRSRQTRVSVAASSAHTRTAADAARPRCKAHGVQGARATVQRRHGGSNIEHFSVIHHR
ncbi:hypothetical protein ECC02_007026 [Trypanosoma cruzi]|uniref:Uncharacterized protein n=1 Tax=Trypanosoma cruzi TaxID=5693 RepID=A0A7J6Y003_TRYCR|nr:hypothetical protein ECC02_007026 [Trypanosoma cruzi]